MTRRCLSVSCCASLPVYLTGYGIFLASFALANWVKYPSEDPATAYSYGLWWNCSTPDLEQVCVPYDIPSLSSNWIAAQAFFIVAVILGFVAGTIYPMIPVNSAFQIISGASALLSTIIFGTSVTLAEGEERDFAFALAPVAGVLLLGNGLVLAWAVKRENCTMDNIMPPERGRKNPKVV